MTSPSAFAIDVHCHVSPRAYEAPPTPGVAACWPCMHVGESGLGGALHFGDKAFRNLDDRSWAPGRRVADMDQDGIAVQVLSPMPELLSHWMDAAPADRLGGQVNGQIAEMVAARPGRFRGLGMVPWQDPALAVARLSALRSEFGLSGIEVGSNIAGMMLGEPRFDAIWEAAEALGLAVFVHALHPVATKSITATPMFTTLAGFPVDVAMAAASILLAGIPERFPELRLAFSHGGGALGSMLGRLDKGWAETGGFSGKLTRRPSESARGFFLDSNVYDPAYLRHLVATHGAGRIVVGTDYPYAIMQKDPIAYIGSAALSPADESQILSGAALAFLAEAGDGSAIPAHGAAIRQLAGA